MTLRYVPRSSLTAILGEVADLALAAGTALAAGLPLPNPIARTPAVPL
jgi:hypothetical protein